MKKRRNKRGNDDSQRVNQRQPTRQNFDSHSGKNYTKGGLEEPSKLAQGRPKHGTGKHKGNPHLEKRVNNGEKS